jgi:Icc-related predicted phosphoesterase
MSDTVKMFFATDCHGSEPVWRKWLSVPSMYGADIIVLAGDLTGKMIVPILKMDDGSYGAKAFGKTYKAKNDQELHQIEEKIRFSGYYPIVTTREEALSMKNDPKRVDKLFEDVAVDNIRRWVKLAEEKVPSKTKIFMMPGNDDNPKIDDAIKESNRVMYVLGKAVDVCFGFQMISMDFSNPTPWKSPRECSENELAKKLEGLKNLPTVPRNKVMCNFHCPPFGTRLDLAPKLDRNLKPVTTLTGMEMDHVGSTAIFNFIKEYQPLIGLHGHIHESAGTDNVGNTFVINPGSEYGEGVLTGMMLEFSEKGLDKWWRISG